MGNDRLVRSQSSVDDPTIIRPIVAVLSLFLTEIFFNQGCHRIADRRTNRIADLHLLQGFRNLPKGLWRR